MSFRNSQFPDLTRPTNWFIIFPIITTALEIILITGVTGVMHRIRQTSAISIYELIRVSVFMKLITRLQISVTLYIGLPTGITISEIFARSNFKMTRLQMAAGPPFPNDMPYSKESPIRMVATRSLNSRTTNSSRQTTSTGISNWTEGNRGSSRAAVSASKESAIIQSVANWLTTRTTNMASQLIMFEIIIFRFPRCRESIIRPTRVSEKLWLTPICLPSWIMNVRHTASQADYWR